jgi:acyl-CoA synthetase (AMP-forming)/AMP-acid ligase II
MTRDNLLGLLERGRRSAPALISPAHDLTVGYARLMDEVHAVRDGLRAADVRPGDVVGIVMPNGPEVLFTFFGVLAAGAVAMPINPDLKPEEIDFALEDSGAALVLVTAGAAARIEGCRALPRRRARVMFSAMSGTTIDGPSAGRIEAGDGAAARPPRPDDDALLLYTSGTTSRPKGVPLTHRNLFASARNVAASYALTAEDVTLCVMPLFHVHGLVASVLATLYAGGTVVVPERFSASGFWPLARRYRPSWFTAVPTIHTILLTTADQHLDGPPPPLRFVRSCSSALAPATQRAFESRFAVPVLQAYGMTEAAHQVATNPLPPGVRKDGSVGLPTGVEVTVLDDTGRELPRGEVGEVAIRGENVTRGYRHNPEATAAAFTAGWFRTGDQGLIDADGYIFLQGRIKELINRGGEKISPLEIDEVLLRHPKVAEAVAVGVPHPVYGEEVEAVVALRPGETCDAEELIAFVREHLADFKAPKAIRFVPQIPRGATGKIQRRRLLELL